MFYYSYKSNFLFGYLVWNFDELKTIKKNIQVRF